MTRFAQFGLLTVLLTTCTGVYADAGLGRLFYTPFERARLDERRIVGVQKEDAAPRTVTLTGRIVRSDGKTVTWTEGVVEERSVEASTTPNNKLKVGQSVELTTGEVYDRLKGGSIVVKRAP